MASSGTSLKVWPRFGVMANEVWMMLAQHHGFRRDIARLEAAYASSPDEAQRAELAKAWDGFAWILHHHHRVEDDHLWPITQDDGGVLADMQSQHTIVNPLIDAISAKVEAGADPADIAAVMGALGRELNSHLDDEEARAVPLVKTTIPADTYAAFEETARAGIPMERGPWLFPWLLDGLSGEVDDGLRGMLPAPMVAMAEAQWVPAYQEHVKAAFG